METPAETTIVGLTSEQARAGLTRFGPNRLVPAGRHPSLVRRVLLPLSDPLVLLLLVAAPVYLLIGDFLDAAVTLAALVPITVLSVLLETRADHALEALRRLSAPTVAVLRDGAMTEVPVEEVVPEDLVSISEGVVVPADGTLVQGSQLAVDESALTGESLPVDKGGPGEAEVLAGTTVLSGRALIRISATGAATRYGRVGSLVAHIQPPRTPLQRRVTRLVRTLGVVAVVFCVGVALTELLRGRGIAAAVIAGVSLGIAAVPGEFPMVYTLYLALGAARLARRNALVRRLPSVETLGSVDVICSDKTGTLTLGRLDVRTILDDQGHPLIEERSRGEGLEAPSPSEARASTNQEETRGSMPAAGAARAVLAAAVRASEPEPFDPLDQALVRFAREHGVDVDALHADTLVRDYPFDPVHKYLTHVWRRADGTHVAAAKGALEGILHAVDAPAEVRDRAHRAHDGLGARGMRVIAVATGIVAVPGGGRLDDEACLRFAGLVGFADPLRPHVREALAECASAGVRVIMITGDHPVTAHAVAEGLDLPHHDQRGQNVIVTGEDIDSADDATLETLALEANIFARTRPEQKHRLVSALRRRGRIVAMTGDGINDAPALREADIGVAMGQRGTQVARESASLVLLDDNFTTIVDAVRDGRRIAHHLQQAFAYLIAFHVPLLFVALLVPLLDQPLMLLPTHLVLLQLVLHPIIALVFEHEPAPADLDATPSPRGRGGAARRSPAPAHRARRHAARRRALRLSRRPFAGRAHRRGALRRARHAAARPAPHGGRAPGSGEALLPRAPVEQPGAATGPRRRRHSAGRDRRGRAHRSPAAPRSAPRWRVAPGRGGRPRHHPVARGVQDGPLRPPCPASFAVRAPHGATT